MNNNSPAINFFSDGISFRLRNKRNIADWINACFRKHRVTAETVNYIFLSDDEIQKLNKQYLGHDYPTDIITFDNRQDQASILADIFVSIDRIRENARRYKSSMTDELHRVMIHGVLHLCGYNDQTANQKKKMREAEDHWLTKRTFA